mgnify:FL=1
MVALVRALAAVFWLDVQRWWPLRGLLPPSLRSRWFLLLLISVIAFLFERVVFFFALLGATSIGPALLYILLLGLFVMLIVLMVVQPSVWQLTSEESAFFSLIPGRLGLLWFAHFVSRRMVPLAVSMIAIGAVGEASGATTGHPYGNALRWGLLAGSVGFTVLSVRSIVSVLWLRLTSSQRYPTQSGFSSLVILLMRSLLAFMLGMGIAYGELRVLQLRNVWQSIANVATIAVQHGEMLPVPLLLAGALGSFSIVLLAAAIVGRYYPLISLHVAHRQPLDATAYLNGSITRVILIKDGLVLWRRGVRMLSVAWVLGLAAAGSLCGVSLAQPRAYDRPAELLTVAGAIALAIAYPNAFEYSPNTVSDERELLPLFRLLTLSPTVMAFAKTALSVAWLSLPAVLVIGLTIVAAAIPGLFLVVILVLTVFLLVLAALLKFFLPWYVVFSSPELPLSDEIINQLRFLVQVSWFLVLSLFLSTLLTSVFARRVKSMSEPQHMLSLSIATTFLLGMVILTALWLGWWYCKRYRRVG